VQTVDLKIVNGEYQPATISVREGLPVRLNVTRDEHSACGEVLVIAAHNVKQTIPVNQPTTIEFTPAKAGELEFTCGMDMMKGKIVVTGAGA
jgi:plastocyanin domain-containing protein